MFDELNFKCGACGGQSFICDNDPPQPEDIISCGSCKMPIGTLDEITKKVLAASGGSQLHELQELRADVFGRKT